MKRRFFFTLFFLIAGALAGKSVIKRPAVPDAGASIKWIGTDGKGKYWWKYTYDAELHPISAEEYAALTNKVRYP
jgi:hypothetical protein